MIDLEQNELVFLKLHRSSTFDLGWGTLFTASNPGTLTWNFLGALQKPATSIESALDRSVELFRDWGRTPCLKVTPASAEWGEVLVREGWKPAARLSHMVHDGAALEAAADVRIRICRSEEELRLFSDVQSRGFGAPDWVKWVHKINSLNAARADQRFYLAEIGSRPAGVCLMLSTGAVSGLYAVATLAEERGKGVARALVARALEDSRRDGATVLCLNTAAEGPAESAFRALGFKPAFDSVFYTV